MILKKYQKCSPSLSLPPKPADLQHNGGDNITNTSSKRRKILIYS